MIIIKYNNIRQADAGHIVDQNMLLRITICDCTFYKHAFAGLSYQ